MSELRDPVLEVLVAERVRHARERAGFTQKQLGIMIGLDINMMSTRATGRVRWSIVELYAVGRALGIDPKSLLP